MEINTTHINMRNYRRMLHSFNHHLHIRAKNIWTNNLDHIATYCKIVCQIYLLINNVIKSKSHSLPAPDSETRSSNYWLDKMLAALTSTSGYLQLHGPRRTTISWRWNERTIWQHTTRQEHGWSMSTHCYHFAKLLYDWLHLLVTSHIPCRTHQKSQVTFIKSTWSTIFYGDWSESGANKKDASAKKTT